jgi:hypothetical protein
MALDRWMHLPLLFAFWGDPRPLLSSPAFKILKCKTENENAQQRNPQFRLFIPLSKGAKGLEPNQGWPSSLGPGSSGPVCLGSPSAHHV